jgi:tetratricopeptide (TPR) repeat protein
LTASVRSKATFFDENGIFKEQPNWTGGIRDRQDRVVSHELQAVLSRKEARLEHWIFLLLLAYVCSFYVDQIFFLNADLGRHLQNGKEYLENFRLIQTNYYSYTETDKPVINHHWGTGIVFYLIWKAIGFEGLSLVNAFLYSVTFCIFWSISRRLASFKTSLFFALLAIPLVTARTEIRPEVFSYLFAGTITYLILFFRDSRISFRLLAGVILAIQVLWVNLHIFFILGPFLLCISYADFRVNRVGRKGREVLVLMLLSLAACLINPHGWRGALIPLTIINELSYGITEQQPILYFLKRYGYEAIFMLKTGIWNYGAKMDRLFLWLSYVHQLVVALFAGGIVIYAFVRRVQLRELVMPAILALGLGVGSVLAIRAVPLFGFFFLSTGAGIWSMAGQGEVAPHNKWLKKFAMIFVLIWILPGVFWKAHYYSPASDYPSPFGIGLEAGVNESADFFKGNELKGPVFNGFNIGGYLIYHLFPEERVFVDNRSEAYSADFLTDVFDAIQRDEATWRDVDKRYGFNVIYCLKDEGTWMGSFLRRRVDDPEWAVVYNDEHVVILLRNTEQNLDFIKEHETSTEIPGVRRLIAGIRNELGMSLAEQGRYKEAIFYYQESLKLDPNLFEGYKNWAQLEAQMGRYSKAIDLYTKAVSIRPTDAAARSNLGVLLLKEGRHDEAQTQFQGAIEGNPSYVKAFINLGAVYQLQGRLDLAENEYAKALRIDPENVTVHTNLGVLANHLGDKIKARWHLEKAVELDPTAEKALEELQLLEA